MAINSISPSWVEEVRSQGIGTIPTADNGSINSDLTAWNKLQTLINQSINSGSPFSNQIVGTYNLGYISTSRRFFGGVLSLNNDIHFIPHSSTYGQKIDINNVFSTYNLVYTKLYAYAGGVLAPNGDIHFVPYEAKVGQKIDVNGVVSTYSLPYTTVAAYSGGLLSPNGDIHMIPVEAGVGQKISTYSSRFDKNVCLSPFFNKI